MNNKKLQNFQVTIKALSAIDVHVLYVKLSVHVSYVKLDSLVLLSLYQIMSRRIRRRFTKFLVCRFVTRLESWRFETAFLQNSPAVYSFSSHTFYKEGLIINKVKIYRKLLKITLSIFKFIHIHIFL